MTSQSRRYTPLYYDMFGKSGGPSLQRYNQSAVDALYRNLPHCCTTCGLRFETAEKLSAHLDWHYFERTRLVQGAHRAKLQRQWYMPSAEWVYTCGGTRLKPLVPAVDASLHTSADSSSDTRHIVRFGDDEYCAHTCPTCGDEIEKAEFDDLGWYYPDAIKGLDGAIHHAECAPLASSLKKRLHTDAPNYDGPIIGPDTKKQKTMETVYE